MIGHWVFSVNFLDKSNHRFITFKIKTLSDFAGAKVARDTYLLKGLFLRLNTILNGMLKIGKVPDSILQLYHQRLVKINVPSSLDRATRVPSLNILGVYNFNLNALFLRELKSCIFIQNLDGIGPLVGAKLVCRVNIYWLTLFRDVESPSGSDWSCGLGALHREVTSCEGYE